MDRKKFDLANFLRIFLMLTGIALLLVVVGIYVAFCPAVNRQLAEKLVFSHKEEIPDRDKQLPSFENVESRAFTILARDGKSKLSAQLHLKKDANLIALLSHGKGLNIFSDRFKTSCLLDAGVSVLAYDYRGYGLSEGKPSMKGVVDDLESAYSWILKNTDYKPGNIILYGESIGSGITCEAAKSIKYGGIILDSGFVSLEKISKEKIPLMNIYPSILMPTPDFNNLDLVCGDHPPLLIVAGAKDEDIPVAHSKQLFKQATEPKSLLILKNSGHIFFFDDRAEFVEFLSSFFDNIAGA